MTIIDRTAATDAEFAERIAAFETASMPVEVLRETLARDLWAAHRPPERSVIPWHAAAGWQQRDYLRMADAALAVVAQQPHPAVRRVEAVLDEMQEWVETELVTDGGFTEQCVQSVIDAVRAALAGDPR